VDNSINRREFLKQGTATAGAAAAARAATRPLAAEGQSDEPVRIGIVGVGGRGRWHVKNMLVYQKDVIIPAICDYRKDRLKMVRTGKPPWIGAYDAASWNSILHYSRPSLDRTGAPGRRFLARWEPGHCGRCRRKNRSQLPWNTASMSASL